MQIKLLSYPKIELGKEKASIRKKGSKFRLNQSKNLERMIGIKVVATEDEKNE